MSIALETQIVASSRTADGYSYTIERDGKRWTVILAPKELAGTQPQRRVTLINRLEEAMRGPADGE